MSEKGCGHEDDDRKRLVKLVVFSIIGFLILLAIVIFLIWAILQPSKPRFVLQDATIYNFTISTGEPPYFLTTTIQVTISTRNPNDRIGIYYQKLDIFATYRNQQITLPTILPTTYQGHKDLAVWSPFLNGNSVPVSPYLQGVLTQDLNVGAVLVNVKIDGRVKWKVGSWISSQYHMYVNCPAYIKFADKNSGIASGPAMKFQLIQSCSVETGLGS